MVIFWKESMAEEKKEVTINVEYLNEIINYIGSSMVGKCLKKVETVKDEEVLKSLLKDTIYEEVRMFRDLITAYGLGSKELIQFRFKSSKPTTLKT